MKPLLPLVIGALAVWTGPKLFTRSEAVPAALVRLPSRSAGPGGRAEVRRYASSRRSEKEQALAYFVLGYREYRKAEYEPAEKDLAIAARVNFPLADFSKYYQASAAYKAGHPGRAVKILEAFASRFPASTKRYEALELRVRCLLQSGDAQSALQILSREPTVRERPSLALLFAQAYLDDGQPEAAAWTYQEVYYAFPTTPESRSAAAAVDHLKTQLGGRFPSVSDEIGTARVEKLFKAAEYKDALEGYSELLAERRTSPWAWRWNLGRAKCLIRLGRGDEAIETLINNAGPTQEIDAERLATLISAYVQTQNDAAIVQTLDKLDVSSFRSHWHAVALESAADYFRRDGNRDAARTYYRTLIRLFPKTPEASKASWRLSWMDYLDGMHEAAQKEFLSLVNNYPQSPHLAAALYYLARLEEKPQPQRARALYKLLEKRFVHQYYALRARRRLEAMARTPAPSATSPASDPQFSVSELAARIPPAGSPPVSPCLSSSRDPDLRVFYLLKAVGLKDLAGQDLKARLMRDPSSPALLLAASKFADEQGHRDRALHIAKKIAPDYHTQPFADLPREIWHLLYPTNYRNEVRRYANANRLDPYLVMAVIRQESGFNPRATSVANARGLMQILPQTVRRSRRYRRAVSRRLYSPAYNLHHGCRYLRQLLKRFNGSVAEALAAYNAGPSRVDSWISDRSFNDPEEFVESIPFPRTRVYVKAVFTDIAVYRKLMTGSAAFAECPNRPRASRRRPASRFRSGAGQRNRFPSHAAPRQR